MKTTGFVIARPPSGRMRPFRAAADSTIVAQSARRGDPEKPQETDTFLDCHVGLWPPRNDDAAGVVVTQPA